MARFVRHEIDYKKVVNEPITQLLASSVGGGEWKSLKLRVNLESQQISFTVESHIEDEPRIFNSIREAVYFYNSM